MGGEVEEEEILHFLNIYTLLKKMNPVRTLFSPFHVHRRFDGLRRFFFLTVVFIEYRHVEQSKYTQ